MTFGDGKVAALVPARGPRSQSAPHEGRSPLAVYLSCIHVCYHTYVFLYSRLWSFIVNTNKLCRNCLVTKKLYYKMLDNIINSLGIKLNQEELEY
jgi:hypothetical protein